MPVWVTKAGAIGPGLVFSTAVAGMVLALLPPVVASAVIAASMLAAIPLACGGADAAAAALLMGARRARVREVDVLAPATTLLCLAGLGPPLIDIRVCRGSQVAGAGIGRRTVVVTSALVDAVTDGDLPPERAAAVIGHAAVVVRAGLVRSDPLLAIWSVPWLLLEPVGRAVAAVGRRLPFAAPAWRLRGIVFAVAVAQAVHDHQFVLAVVLVVLGACSYLLPIARGRWEATLLAVGDHGLISAGLGEHMAAFLRRCPQTGAAQARLRVLDPQPRHAPRLGLVVADR